MDTRDMFLLEYEDFAAEILRIFEINNREVTRDFRFRKNKISKRIFSKKFSRLFQKNPNQVMEKFLIDLEQAVSNLVASNQKLREETATLHERARVEALSWQGIKNELEKRIGELREEISLQDEKLVLLNAENEKLKIDNKELVVKLEMTLKEKETLKEDNMAVLAVKDVQFAALEDKMKKYKNISANTEKELNNEISKLKFYLERYREGDAIRIQNQFFDLSKSQIKNCENNENKMNDRNIQKNRFFKLWEGRNIRKMLCEYLSFSDWQKIEILNKYTSKLILLDPCFREENLKRKIKGIKS